jgi:hypothetical protein
MTFLPMSSFVAGRSPLAVHSEMNRMSLSTLDA